MNNKLKTRYFKLSGILIKSNKVVFSVSLIAAIMGFTFLFTFSSLSQTIIETKQKEAADTYGKFLVVASDLSNKQIDSVKEKITKFDNSTYEVMGNVRYDTNTITMGRMDKKLGEDLGFRLEEGKWSSDSNEIVIEEYLKSLFHIEDMSLPCTISLEMNGEKSDYIITGIISNYSSMLSVCDYVTIDTNVYPSIISGGKITKTGKKSLVIKQKKLNYKTAEKEMYSIASVLSNIEPGIENVSVNEKLYAKAYMDNEDMIHLKMAYQIILNVLLALAQIMILRYFLLRNKKTLYLFQALGLSEKQKRRCVFGFAGSVILFSLVLSYMITLCIGSIFMNHIFEGYNSYYVSAFMRYFAIECIVLVVIAAGGALIITKGKRASIINEMTGSDFIHKRAYRFKKIDWCIVFVQIICMFFIMATINFSTMFKIEREDIQCTLYSKSTGVSQPAMGYNVSENGKKYFSFDSILPFLNYEKYINISMDGETKYSSIILDKDCEDEYFCQSYFEEEAEMNEGYEDFNKRVPKEAEQYKVISDSYVNVKVLPKAEYHNFLKTNKIENSNLENENDDSCILIVPNYDTLNDKAVMKENGVVQLGRIEYNKKKLVFRKHSFRIEKLLTPKDSDNSKIQIIISEDVARKSQFILGYDTIWITIDKDSPASIHKEINSEMALLMASLQGGRLDSSAQTNKNDILLEKYTTMISKTVLLFSILSICIYILLNSYIDWEKNKYEYGVLRSIGMSYSMLQHKLFIRYSNSIIIAAIIAIFIGNNAFPNGELKVGQIGISVAAVITITYICRIYIYVGNRKKSISTMLKDLDEKFS